MFTFTFCLFVLKWTIFCNYSHESSFLLLLPPPSPSKRHLSFFPDGKFPYIFSFFAIESNIWNRFYNCSHLSELLVVYHICNLHTCIKSYLISIMHCAQVGCGGPWILPDFHDALNSVEEYYKWPTAPTQRLKLQGILKFLIPHS